MRVDALVLLACFPLYFVKDETGIKEGEGNRAPHTVRLRTTTSTGVGRYGHVVIDQKVSKSEANMSIQ